MKDRLIFRAAAGALVLGALIHVATLWPRVTSLAETVGPRSWLIVAAFALTALTALAACGLALLLLWKAPDRPDARALALFLGFLAIFWGSVFRFMEVGSTSDSLSVNVNYGSGWVSQSALAALLLASAAFLRFSALFPRRVTPDRLPRPRFPVARWAGAVRRAFLRPGVVWGSAVLVYLAQRYGPGLAMRVSGPPEAGEMPPPLFLAALVGALFLLAGYALFCMVLGARNLRLSHRLATPEERPRTLWVVTGFTAASWMVVGGVGLVGLSLLPGFDSGLLSAAIPLALVLAPLVLVIGASIGILYSGAIDPALALERSTLYGVLGAIGVVAFAGLENAVSEAVEEWLGLPGAVGSTLAGGLVALALIPLRNVMRQWIRRRNVAAAGVSDPSAGAAAGATVASATASDPSPGAAAESG
jgi:hypothetical protein